MNNNIIFIQSAGIGDIFFLQHAANMFYEKGYNIIWPIKDTLMPTIRHIQSKANFIPISLYKTDNSVFKVNFQAADQLFKNISVMEAKYNLIGKPEEAKNWLKGLKLTHWYNDKMFSNLNLRDEKGNIKKYEIVSDYVGTPPGHSRRPINIDSENEIVRVTVDDKYTIFDWLTIFFKAQKIHLVDTCYVYLLEYIFQCIKKPDDFFNMYSRFNPADFSAYNDILNLKWNFKNW